jgi:DNA-binding MarR family transcriptional regulator
LLLVPNERSWTFVTNHALVLLAVATHPGITLRAIAERLHVTERTVRTIVVDLEEAGYLTARRSGRGKQYSVDATRRMRHPLMERHQIGELLSVLEDDARK